MLEKVVVETGIQIFESDYCAEEDRVENEAGDSQCDADVGV